MQIATLLVVVLGALGTAYLVLIERARRREEIAANQSAAISVTYERRAGDAYDYLVIANTGRAEALDVDLVTFNSRADGRNAHGVLLEKDKTLPIPRLAGGGGGRVTLPVVLNIGDAMPPWQVAVRWTDGLGSHVGEDFTVTMAL